MREPADDFLLFIGLRARCTVCQAAVQVIAVARRLRTTIRNVEALEDLLKQAADARGGWQMNGGTGKPPAAR